MRENFYKEFWDASFNADLDAFNRLFQEGINAGDDFEINQTNDIGMTALHLVIARLNSTYRGDQDLANRIQIVKTITEQYPESANAKSKYPDVHNASTRYEPDFDGKFNALHLVTKIGFENQGNIQMARFIIKANPETLNEKCYNNARPDQYASDIIRSYNCPGEEGGILRNILINERTRYNNSKTYFGSLCNFVSDHQKAFTISTLSLFTIAATTAFVYAKPDTAIAVKDSVVDAMLSGMEKVAGLVR